MEQFQLSMYDNCGEIENFSTCGKISDLHMTDVEKSEILHIWHVCGVENVAIYAKFMHFLATNYALLCGEKMSPKVH